jgi:hypothetical protein
MIRFLVDNVGVLFNLELRKDVTTWQSAVASACRNGHDETLAIVLEYGAQIPTRAMTDAICGGSFLCVKKLLETGTLHIGASQIEYATACGHADVLRLLLGSVRPTRYWTVATNSSKFGNALMIAWLDCHSYGSHEVKPVSVGPEHNQAYGSNGCLRVLLNAGATYAWTPAAVSTLMSNRGRAAQFTEVVALVDADVRLPGWIADELLDAVCAMLQKGSASLPLVCDLIRRFPKCLEAEKFTALVMPLGLTPEMIVIGEESEVCRLVRTRLSRLTTICGSDWSTISINLFDLLERDGLIGAPGPDPRVVRQLLELGAPFTQTTAKRADGATFFPVVDALGVFGVPGLALLDRLQLRWIQHWFCRGCGSGHSQHACPVYGTIVTTALADELADRGAQVVVHQQAERVVDADADPEEVGRRPTGGV